MIKKAEMSQTTMSREDSGNNEVLGELGVPSMVDLDSEVARIIKSDNDSALEALGIKAMKITPPKYVFDDQNKLRAKVEMFYTSPSTARTQRGIHYHAQPTGDGFSKQFTFSWDPLFPEQENLQRVSIEYADTEAGEAFTTVTTGFNTLDLQAIEEAINDYRGEPGDA